MLPKSPIKITMFFYSIWIAGAAGSEVRISVSGDSSKPPTIAEEAVDQLQENEKLVAGKYFIWVNWIMRFQVR